MITFYFNIILHKKSIIKMLKYVLISFIITINSVCAFELLGDDVYIEEVLPLFNKHETSYYVSHSDKVINPKELVIPSSAKLGAVNKKISMEGFIGEIFFKDILLTTSSSDLDIEISIKGTSQSGINITPKIVTSWYQSGVSTKQKKVSGVLTYELLLTDDRSISFDDKWVKSEKGGWVYVPPIVDLSDALKTKLTSNSNKRILLKVSLDKEALPGQYYFNLEITAYKNNRMNSLLVPVELNVKPVKLVGDVSDKYKIFLYTAFKINDFIERSGAYVNAMRLHGTEDERLLQLSNYISDIKDHGFNGITIHDWDSNNLEKTLKVTQQSGIKYAVLHATTPVNKKYKFVNNPTPIVNDFVKNIYESFNMDLYFYGYDESGGNKYLDKQLKLNQRIHSLMGKSVNAVFWDDMPNVINEINDTKSKCFDVIAHSLGSHGYKEMFNSLPFKAKEDLCSKQGSEHLVYWHPHVENPVLNRIFMGFWLWASGFDGVIPHGYYFPSHIEKVLSPNDIKRGVSNVTSPYNDWSFWLPGTPLRHHNAVYPSKSGPVGTLQWEGVLNGYMDLKFIITLERKLEDSNISDAYKSKVNKLLTSIRDDILKINTSYMSDKDSLIYLKKLESWKKEISILLLN